MKVIIAGSRDIRDMKILDQALYESEFLITEVVCGMMQGVDSLGYFWATAHGIPVKQFHANWEKYGRAAGPIRNGEMAAYADALIVIHHNTPGSLDMLAKAKKWRLKIFEKVVDAPIGCMR